MTEGSATLSLRKIRSPSGSRWKKVNKASLSFRSNGLSVTVVPSFSFTSLGYSGFMARPPCPADGWDAMEHDHQSLVFIIMCAGPGTTGKGGEMGGKVIVEGDGG